MPLNGITDNVFNNFSKLCFPKLASFNGKDTSDNIFIRFLQSEINKKAYNNPIKRHLHKCTQVENPGGRVVQAFAKIPGGSRLSGKTGRGVP